VRLSIKTQTSQRFSGTTTTSPNGAGPNTDNNYLLASVDGEGEYVITGTALNPRGFIIQTGTGGMESGTVEIFGEKTDRDFEFEPAVDFHIVLSATPRSGNWMALHPRTTEVSIREYFVNWEHDQTCRFRIDRIDQTATAPQRLDPAAVADKLDTAGRWVERSLVFWNEFYRDRLPVANAISTAPLGVAGGAENIVYGSGRWSLDTGEGLLVELEEPRARYWSLQLYSTGWFESLDFANRQTSLNGHQMHIDADGLVRIIISGTDPGIDNWLDTERRRNGIVIFRSIGTDERASLTCQVIPLTDIRARLPSATPHVSTDQRQAVIGQRRAGIARRFRR
jgi:hypothetical protein